MEDKNSVFRMGFEWCMANKSMASLWRIDRIICNLKGKGIACGVSTTIPCPWWDRLWREIFWSCNSRPYTHGMVKLVLFRQLEFWRFLTLNASVSNLSSCLAGLCIKSVNIRTAMCSEQHCQSKPMLFFPLLNYLMFCVVVAATVTLDVLHAW